MPVSNFKILGGSSNPLLVEDVIQQLKHKTSDWSLKPVDCLLDKFSDGETRVEINENLRGHHIFVIQSLSNPVNDNFMELCIILDTLKRCNVSEVTVIIPYFGYSRQDKKDKPRTPISAKMISDILQTCGLDRVVTIDLHSPQIQGYFNCPVDNLYGSKVLLKHMPINSNELVVVSPDRGGVERSSYYSKKLNCSLAFCYKHRDKPNEISEMRLIGCVEDKDCILVDDMADTCGTLIKATEMLKSKGARNVSAYITHPVLSGDGIEKLEKSCIDSINVTNSISLSDRVLKNPRFNVISIDDLIADAILNIFDRKSISRLFV